MTAITATTPLLNHPQPNASSSKMCRVMKKCGLVSAACFAALLVASPVIGLALSAASSPDIENLGRIWFLVGGVVSIVAIGSFYVQRCDRTFRSYYASIDQV